MFLSLSFLVSFVDLRLQLLDTDRNYYLLKALYGLLMLLPQSAAFILLRNRLDCVPNVHILPGPKQGCPVQTSKIQTSCPDHSCPEFHSCPDQQGEQASETTGLQTKA
eukprot:Seg7968.2 transcript_id=Seg7968.2/GoldUCD/mRNA.D3Y31 product="Protein VAC14-like" protein_id=Seg7968.2/GoldUCD/D3Y31